MRKPSLRAKRSNPVTDGLGLDRRVASLLAMTVICNGTAKRSFDVAGMIL
jgi:hypothetical protein